jgi:glycosyltransferase involved in cell wall biosynthesis
MTQVSIITPSFNQATFIAQAMLSVLQQDYPDIEYLVVDGGSTDGSVEIIKEHGRRLAWWTSETDAGQAEAINKGLARAHGDIIAWLNSDDYYLPGAVSAAVNSLHANPGAVLVYGNMLAVDERGTRINSLNYRQLSLEDLLCFQIIGQPAVFFRRDALDRAGRLDTSLHFLLDHQLWIRLAQQGQMIHVDQTWAAARYHAAAKNRTGAPQFGREAFRILEWAANERHLAAVLQRVSRRAHASAHRVDARYLLDGGQPSAALRAWLRSLALHPPTALARLNLPASAMLEMIGLGGVRGAILRGRQRRLSL